MDIVEKIARDLCKHDGENPDQMIGSAPPHFKWELFTTHAKVALNAARNPTDNMILCGEAVMDEEDVKLIYEAMINGALD